MAKCHSQLVNLPGARSLMNPLPGGGGLIRLCWRNKRITMIFYEYNTCIGWNFKRLMWRFVDFIVQQNKRFLLFRVRQKDATRKSAFQFGYVISRQGRATQRKLHSNVHQVKQCPRAKIQLFLSNFKNGRKIKGRSCSRPFNFLQLKEAPIQINRLFSGSVKETGCCNHSAFIQ